MIVIFIVTAAFNVVIIIIEKCVFIFSLSSQRYFLFHFFALKSFWQSIIVVFIYSCLWTKAEQLQPYLKSKDADVKPAGLGLRQGTRHDIGEETKPFKAVLAWTIGRKKSK